MATEQDWTAYADQSTLASNDTILARTAAGAGVEVPGSALVRYDASGNVGIGTASPANLLDVQANTAGYNGMRVRNVSSSASAVTLLQIGNDTNAAAAALELNSGANSTNFGGVNALVLRNGLAAPLVLGTSNTARLLIETGGNVRPASDNSQNLGTASFRWATVFAGTGTINTSDEREKQWRGGLNAAELRAAKRIAGEIGVYQWLDAIAEKGDAARLHIGPRAQRVWMIMAEEGLIDPLVDGLPGNTPYAFLCFDEWEATPAIPAKETVLDGDGNVIELGHEGVPFLPAGNRFGLRVDQLALFLIAAQEQRLCALEAAL